MTGVKQRRDSWEVLILEGGEGDRWMGLPNGEAPSHLALVADAKSPYSHPQPPAQAKDTWLWVGRLSAQPLPPPGVQGTLDPVGMETGK